MDGLYRISGKANDLLKLKKEFDNGVWRTSVCNVAVTSYIQSGWRASCRGPVDYIL